MTAISLKNVIEASDTSVTLVVEGYNYAMAQVTGTWSGALAFEGTVDGENWFAIVGTGVPSGSTTSSTLTNGQFSFTVSGLLEMRVRGTLINSGGAVVAIRATE